MEKQVRDYGFSPAQQDETWRRWREGPSFSLMGRALGAPMHQPRRFLHQSNGPGAWADQRRLSQAEGVSMGHRLPP